jgi:YbbR domain-containing protein
MVTWSQPLTGQTEYLYDGGTIGVGQQFYTGHPLIGKDITNVKFNIKKVGSPPSSAKFKCVTLDSSNTIKQTHGSEMLMENVSTTYGLVEFDGSDVSYNLQNDDRLALISTGSGSDGSNSIIVQLCSSCTPDDTTGGYEESSGWTNRSDRSCTMEASSSTISSAGLLNPPQVAYI